MTDTAAGVARRDQVLQHLRTQHAPSDVTTIAHAVGAHPNTVRYHLDALCDRGQVSRTLATAERPGRPSYEYAAVLGMNPDGPRNYELLAKVLLAGLGSVEDPEEAAENAGRAWGAHIGNAADADTHPLTGLVNVLQAERFAPEVADSAHVVDLHHCPFLDLVESRSAAVCRVHLGLMRGYLEARNAPFTVDRLEPFAAPDFCRAHLSMGAPIMTDVTNLNDLAAEQLEAARASTPGRTARSLYGGRGHELRQNLLAIAAGRALGEHESPGDATLQVVIGRVRLTAGDESWELSAGDFIGIPPVRHNLEALEDSAVVLTVKITSA